MIELDPNDHENDELGTFLAGWRAPPVSRAAAEKLALTLARIPLPTRPEQRQLTYSEKWRQGLLILSAQRRMVSGITWVASTLVLVLGVIVTLFTSASEVNTLPFVIAAPLVTAVGAAFLYGEDTDAGAELQYAAPVSPQVILLARLVLLFGFNLALSLVGSALLTTVNAHIGFTPLIMTWLAPMMFLSAFAFLLSVVFFDPLLSVILAMAVWTLLVARHTFDLAALARLPDLLQLDAHPILWVAAAASLTIALGLAASEERLLKGVNR
ncbi:MAG: hypothetical protein H7Y11_13680 [Armatimonadetes bacterium]|nr:hypothetical protein [Anaerolineae bacterium]